MELFIIFDQAMQAEMQLLAYFLFYALVLCIGLRLGLVIFKRVFSLLGPNRQ